MRTRIGAAIAVCAIVFGRAMAGDMPAKKPSSPAFDRLKSLVGTWSMEMPDGKKMTNTYALVSRGTCLMETITGPDGETMVTMYRADGSNLALDHYCGLGNVPHMKGTASADGKTYDFVWTSGANMTAKDMHMHALHMTLDDGDHMTQQWTLFNNGKAQGDPHVMHLVRAAQ